MEQKKLLGRFQFQLLWQVLLRSVLWGLIGGAVAVTACLLVYLFKIQTPVNLLLLKVGMAGFVCCFLPCTVAFFPTKKRTARALDRTGLQERVGTMLAFENKEGLLVELQRKDAAEHIKKTSVGKLWLRLRLVELILVVASVGLCVGVMAIPDDLLAPEPKPPVAVDPRAQEVQAKLDALRQQLRESELAEETLAELEAILAQLEQDLMNADSELEEAALIQDAQEQMQDVLWNTISRRVIGRALQQYDLTTAFGARLCMENEYWEVSDEMNQMKSAISGKTKQLGRLSKNITNALEISGVSETDSLYMALGDFAEGLNDMSNYTVGPDGEQGWTMSDLDFLFEVAEKNIREALEEQAHDEAEVQEMDALISTSLQNIVDDEGSEIAPQLSGNKQSGGGKGNKQPSGGGEGNASGTPVGGIFDGPGQDGERTTMLEDIYDPMSGDVAYGDVFAAYYAEYLKDLDAGDISEELRPYFERYFSSLS